MARRLSAFLKIEKVEMFQRGFVSVAVTVAMSFGRDNIQSEHEKSEKKIIIKFGGGSGSR